MLCNGRWPIERETQGRDICILCLDTQVPGMQIRRLRKLVGNRVRVNNGDENICAARGKVTLLVNAQ